MNTNIICLSEEYRELIECWNKNTYNPWLINDFFGIFCKDCPYKNKFHMCIDVSIEECSQILAISRGWA